MIIMVEKKNFLPQIIAFICFLIGLIILIVGGLFLEKSDGNPEGYEGAIWGIGLQLGGCCLLLIGTIILIICFERWKKVQ